MKRQTTSTMKTFITLICAVLLMTFFNGVNAEAADDSSVGHQIAIEASKDEYQGIPYVWAGDDTSGFDCSGFVLYVYAKFGYDLPHYTGSQRDMGTRVSYSDLQEGDLVFFYPDDGHVGIYVGNGNVVHAGSNGITTSTIESGYYLENLNCCVRIIK
mgnify:CR=1 FL=1